jgi:hypothetical protein
MAKNINELATKLGANVIAKIPDVGGGAFGANRIACVVAEIQKQLRPSEGKRPGRPTNPKWEVALKVPMSTEVETKLAGFAALASIDGRRVSKMQLAAHLLEEAVMRLEAVPATPAS